jgi:hypothetical protein
MKAQINYSQRLKRDLLIVAISIVLAVIFVKIGVLQSFLTITEEIQIISSFIAGLFFTSIFTIAPASITLAHIGEHMNPPTVALWGAVGAMLGDLIIFFFIRDVFADDLMGALKASRFRKSLHNLRFGFLRWVAPLVGAIVIASPLPDEIGLTLMGLSKVRTIYLIPLAFVLNFLGIFVLVTVAG